MENIRTRVALVTGLVGLFLVTGIGAASAQEVDPVQTAFDDMGDKITTYGGAIVALVVLAVGIFLGIKYLRKGVAKA